MAANLLEGGLVSTEPPAKKTAINIDNRQARIDFQNRLREVSLTWQTQNKKTNLIHYMNRDIALMETLIPALRQVNGQPMPAYHSFSNLLENHRLNQDASYHGKNEHNVTYFNKIVLTAFYYQCGQLTDNDITNFVPKREIIPGQTPIDIPACRSAINNFSAGLRKEIGLAMCLHLLSLDDFLDVETYSFRNIPGRKYFFQCMFKKYPNLMVLMADSAGMVLNTQFVYCDAVYTPNLDANTIPGSDPAHNYEDQIKRKTRLFHQARAVKLMDLVFRTRLNVPHDDPFPSYQKYGQWASGNMNYWDSESDIVLVKGLLNMGELPVKESFEKINRKPFARIFKKHFEAESMDLSGDNDNEK